ncbi:hypothetical protein [Streptomyces sp. RFCAC02]|uniref:hypothetical protein n=1 Tax=Streptomyces sp. RFCAC02 TaxID=2499143 RepID=UPI0010226CA4|nr:hypothetical protein [Streptomyces sp. RFCAC02]
MKRHLARIAVPLAATAAVVAATGTPAAAASDADVDCGLTWSNEYKLYDPCGWVYFQSETGDGTEYLVLHDTNSDGYGVIVQNYRYDMADAGPYSGTVTSGKGTHKVWTLHMPEGTAIDFRICPYTTAHGPYYSQCSNWVRGIA